VVVYRTELKYLGNVRTIKRFHEKTQPFLKNAKLGVCCHHCLSSASSGHLSQHWIIRIPKLLLASQQNYSFQQQIHFVNYYARVHAEVAHTLAQPQATQQMTASP